MKKHRWRSLFILSLRRHLELLRVSRPTDANTEKKSGTDTWQVAAGRECVSAGQIHEEGHVEKGLVRISAQVPGVLLWGQS